MASGSDAVNTLSPDGWTPLHLAAFFGHPDIVELLLVGGADPTIRSRAFERNLPIHAACAARDDDPRVLRPLIAVSDDIDNRQEEGWTALMIAAANGHGRMAQTLLDGGADPSLANPDGATPAEIARERGHLELASLLENA